MSERKPTRALLLLCLISGLSWGQVDGQHVAAVISALQARQYDRALQVLAPELQQHPNDPRLRTLQGIALSGKGDSGGALVAFRWALRVSRDYLPALEGAAQIEYQQDNTGAITTLNHILRLRPDDPTAHGMMAAIAYRRNDCTTAVQHFGRSGELSDSNALREYGTCLVRLRQMEKATVVFQRLVSTEPENALDRRRLATVELIAEHPKEALVALQPLLQQNPDAAILELAASAYEAEHDTPNAVRSLRQAIINSPTNIGLYVDFASISIAHQSFQVGIDMINSGLRLQPKAAALYVTRGILYVQLANYSKAQADFEYADHLNPSLSVASVAQGFVAEQKDDLDTALAIVQSKLKAKPNDAFLLYLKAEILDRKGPLPGTLQFQEAVTAARRAVEAEPRLVRAHDLLAELELQSGHTTQAVEQCRQALGYDPKDQIALYHLIVGLRKSNRRDEIPGLLKRLAQLRQEATREEAERNRYKLVEGDVVAGSVAQP